MQISSKGKYVFSASDLVHFLACHHLTFLDLTNLLKKIPKTEESALNKLLQKKGFEHEAQHLRLLQEEGKTVCDIPKERSLDERARLTEEALYSGVDVIFQAVFYSHPWRGDADFLIKVDLPSKLGSFSYEVVDTKLAKNPEPKHLIQLCFYSDLLGNVQGVKPKNMHLVLGDKRKMSFKFVDFAYYYSQTKLRFKSFAESPPIHSYPEPCEYCKFCAWLGHCAKQWENDKHLSLVANIQRSQIDKLRRANIKTIDELAGLPADCIIPDLNREVFQRLRSQAALQVYKNQNGQDKYEVIPYQENHGFSRMPKPDSGDLFFDMEGDPLYPNGLEYLFGIFFLKNGGECFKPFWAHDHKQERETFSCFMQFINDHISAHPHAHIYHYNHYETSALKRLACRYAIAEEQIDNLLRQQKFVDLYKVVRESIRTSEPGYSIKNLETFYMEKRDGAVATATDSIIVYNEWRETGDDQLLDQIVKYNEIDCISTQKLRDWLLSLKPAHCPWFNNLQENETDRSVVRKDWEIEYEDHLKKLLDGDYENRELRIRLANLLEFHRREAKPEHWARYDRQDKFVEELIEDMECLAGLEFVSEINSLNYIYKFPPQEYKLRRGDQVENVLTLKKVGSIVEINEDSGIIKIKRSGSELLPLNLSICASSFISTKEIRAAIYRMANSVIDGINNYPAILDILNKALPRIQGKIAGEAIINSENIQVAAVEAILKLHQSYLFIQGPPGAGKTHTSAHIIVELMRQGKKIGISANSHKAIHALLDKIEEVALSQDFHFSGIKKSTTSDDSIYKGLHIKSESKTEKINLSVSLVAGTAWLFSNERFDQKLDYLFIDEAGQVSVANVVAMGTAAKNIILVGDQMQLGQPIQAVHPGEAGQSILEFLLGDHATIPPERGIFLDHTRRLHPSICSFISKAFYDARLSSHSSNEMRSLIFENQIDGITNEGVHLIPADHSGCSQKSVEEGVIIKKYYDQLLRQQFRDKDGIERELTENDILVVTPYNVQVNHLKSILPNAKVGTVDKFQGQEAPIVLISMVTSSAEDLPRNIEFLYSKNRLNVALSRAQCLAVVVVNRELLDIPCKTIEQMQLVNTFCWLSDFVSEK